MINLRFIAFENLFNTSLLRSALLRLHALFSSDFLYSNFLRAFHLTKSHLFEQFQMGTNKKRNNFR